MRPLTRLASVCIFAASAALGQVRETVHVNLVEVPVTVVDRDGNPVRGLKLENFELLDEGKKRAITTFDVIDFSSPSSTKGSPLNPAARRNFLLLFDLTFSSPLGRAKAQEAALNFLARGLQRRDLGAVATIDVYHGFRLLTAFTTDRTLLAAAVGNPMTFRSSDPLQISGSQAFEPAPAASTQSSGTNTHGVDDFAAEIQRGQNRLDDQFNRGRIEKQIYLLGGLARTLRMLPGRKQVVFFSEGFDPRLVQGRDARATADVMEDMALAERGEPWKIDSDLRYGNTGSLSIVQQMARLFRGSDAVLHAVDIRGVRVQNDLERGSTINSNEALFLISSPTGGEVFRNSNNLKTDLEQMLRRQELVYVLGFQAPTGNPGKFHELKVRLRDVSGARLFHRAGYYESGAESALERALSNAEIVLNDLPQSDIGVAALAAPFPTKGKAQVPVILEISGPDLIREAANPNAAVLEIYIYAFDEDGIVRDRMFQRLTIDLGKIAGKLKESGIKYYATLSLPEGKYAVKSLVRLAETERKGYARTDVVVPPPVEVSVLPPFFFEEPGKWLMVKGGSHDTTNAGYPFQINGEPFIPSAAVSVRSGQPRQFALFIYNAGVDEVAWETMVTDAKGAAHQTTPNLLKQMQGDDVTKLMFQYSPGELDRGAARLDITVHKKGSSDARKTGVPFIVQR
jgi:VWFA-related protein